MSKARVGSSIACLMVVLVLGQFVAVERAQAAPENGSILKQLGEEIATIAAEAKPAVVQIIATKIVKNQAPEVPEGMDEMFERFFGPQFQVPRQERREQQFRMDGLGTGFVIDPSGVILTNSHVVADSDELEVIMHDEKKYKARVLGSDPESEVAVIKIDAENLKTLKTGNSDDLKVGHFVVAIGNPQGLSQSVSFGIVSAINRSEVRITDFSNFIQTDAAINKGNSGGPLLDSDGRVIGVNTAIVSTTGGSQGLGFAIPINQALQIANVLRDKGKMERGYLGIWMQELSPEMAEFMGAKGKGGAVVLEVTKGAPAEGVLEVNDAIVAVNDQSVEDSQDVMNRIAALAPDDRVKLAIIRGGKERNVTLKLGTRPSRRDLLEARVDGFKDPGVPRDLELGFSVEALSPEKAKALGFDESKQGLLVTKVDASSEAHKNGLRENMVIEQVNLRDVKDLKDIDKAFDAQKDKTQVMLRVATPRGAQLILIPRQAK